MKSNKDLLKDINNNKALLIEVAESVSTIWSKLQSNTSLEFKEDSILYYISHIKDDENKLFNIYKDARLHTISTLLDLIDKHLCEVLKKIKIKYKNDLQSDTKKMITSINIRG